MPTRRQEDVYGGVGTEYEKKGVRWLKHKGFRVLKEFRGPHNDYFDALAEKDKEKWIVEIKGGDKPSIRISNVGRMIDTKGIDRVGLLFLPEGQVPFLFELSRRRYAGWKASETKGKVAESIAGEKSWKSRGEGGNS
jgi:hypothetical protein